MKFKNVGPSSSAGGGSHAPHTKPDWLKEWIANKGRYVILQCGHREDINAKHVLLIYKSFGPIDIMCDRCNEWTQIHKAISFTTYAQIEAQSIPETPLF